MDNIEEKPEDITLESLKNENNNNNLELVLEETPQEETHLEYKKRLNKKVSQFTEEEKAEYNKLVQRKRRKENKQEEKIKKTEEETEEITKKTNDLYNQLFVLKKKFPEHLNDIHIDKDMNMSTLSQKKDLILRIITQKNSDAVIFETLLLGCRTVERGFNYAQIDALDGYADNINEARDDIVPILKEMIDMGEIDVSMLTPQLRLMIVMSSVAVKTVEQNNDKKKKAVIVEELDTS